MRYYNIDFRSFRIDSPARDGAASAPLAETHPLNQPRFDGEAAAAFKRPFVARVIVNRSHPAKKAPPRLTHSRGSVLRDFRLFRRLLQADLAKLAGISQGSISAIERGYSCPSIEARRRIAQALDVSEELLFGEEPKPSDPGPGAER